MDPFASFRHILEQRCPSCQAPVDSRADACPRCGALRDEPEETLDVVIDGNQPRIAVASGQNNLSRLLADLRKIERGEMRSIDAVKRVDTVIASMRSWRDRMRAMKPTTPLEQEMHGQYLPLSTYMTQILESYQQALTSGDMDYARELMSSLSDGFFILGELLNRYDN